MSKKSSPKIKDLNTKKNPKGGGAVKMQVVIPKDGLVVNPPATD